MLGRQVHPVYKSRTAELDVNLSLLPVSAGDARLPQYSLRVRSAEPALFHPVLPEFRAGATLLQRAMKSSECALQRRAGIQ
mmetsp:Transcript_58806/g.137653  ORF Transcript_58806/g.137653 Transcript_58806/m.137653 type:complete len:81 (+) Transcript_58806:89-331(+)